MCTHCLNSLMVFLFCIIICISLFWIEYLKMESVNWPKYLTTCKSCDFSHFKGELILFDNTLMGTLPTEIGYLNELGKLLCTHYLNSLMDFYSVHLFVNNCYEYMIWSWRVLTGYLSPLASRVTFSFQRGTDSVR